MVIKYIYRLCLLTAALPWTLYSLDAPIVQPKATTSFTQDEVEALKEWVQAKKQVVGIKSLGGELTFSGEVHAGMSYTNEVVNNVRQRGSGGAVPGVGSRDFLVEMDLLMNYRTEITWATAKVKFKNRAGITSGTADKVSLDRAFMGVRFLEGETYTMALEAGRRKLNYTFDSIIQFSAFMDGLLYKYDQSIESVGDLYLYGGPFVVDFTEDHYAYIFELGVLNIGNTGLYTKYSLINWDTKSYSNPLKDDAFRFINSQLTLGYKIVPKWLGKVLTVYGAGLVNSAAKPLAITNYKKANYAWYIVWAMGEARKQGDWSLQVDYQYVMPQAVPSFDCAGIGRGNAAGAGFYSVDGKSKTPTTIKTATGNTNYKGFEAVFLYLFTNNLTLRQSYQMSIRQNKEVGPIFRFKQYGMELVYLF